MAPLEMVRLTKTQSMLKKELGPTLSKTIRAAAEFIGLTPRDLNHTSEQFMCNMITLHRLLKETTPTINSRIFTKDILRLFLLHFNHDLDANQTIQCSDDKKTITLTQSPPITFQFFMDTSTVTWGENKGIITTHNQGFKSLQSVYVGEVAHTKSGSPIITRHGKGKELFYFCTNLTPKSPLGNLFKKSKDCSSSIDHQMFHLLKSFSPPYCNCVTILYTSFANNAINPTNPKTELHSYFTNEICTILNTSDELIEKKSMDDDLVSHPEILNLVTSQYST